MKTTESIRVGALSMTSTPDKKRNISRAFDFLSQGVDLGVRLLVLPEMFSCYGDEKAILEASEFSDGQLSQKLARFAQKNQIFLVAGSVPEKSQEADSKVYNSSFVFSPEGKCIAHYRKIHLFNLLDENKNKIICESDLFLAGNKVQTFEIDGWNMGLAICYDLRFPELFNFLGKDKELDCILLPSAFTYVTGKAHWEILLRARAIENSSYLVAANQVGNHTENRRSFGHSMVIDPWGRVDAMIGDQEGWAISQMNLGSLKDARCRIPVRTDRLGVFND